MCLLVCCLWLGLMYAMLCFVDGQNVSCSVFDSFSMLFFFPLQIYLNYLANYVPNAWNYEQGCGNCDQNMVDLSQANVSQTVKKKPILG